MIGDAVNVTGEPEHDVTVVGVILTAGVAVEVIVTVTALLVAFGAEAHNALPDITTETTSLILSVEEVKVLPEPATFIPFTFH